MSQKSSNSKEENKNEQQQKEYEMVDRFDDRTHQSITQDDDQFEEYSGEQQQLTNMQRVKIIYVQGSKIFTDNKVYQFSKQKYIITKQFVEKYPILQQILQKFTIVNFLLIMVLMYNQQMYNDDIHDYCDKKYLASPEKCIEYIADYTGKNIEILFYCSVMHVLICYFCFVQKKIDKIIGICSILLYLYQTNIHYGRIDIDSISIRNHRTGIILGYISLTFLTIFVLYFILSVIFLVRRYSKKILGLIALFIFMIYLYIHSILISSCDGWDDGLVDSIQDDGINCVIKRPQICYPNLIDNWLNLSKGSTCELDMSTKEKKREIILNAIVKYRIIDPQEDDEFLQSEGLDDRKAKKLTEKEIDEFIDKNKYIGWPSFKELDVIQRTNEDLIIDHLVANSTYYDNKEDALNGKHEILVDVHNQQLIVNVTKNEEILQKRQEQAKNFDSFGNNVIMIYVDTVSRPQMYRKLPKTAEFLKKYAQNQKIDSGDQETEVYEFFRFHSIQGRTFSNVMRLQFDVITPEFRARIKYPNQTHPERSIFKDFQEAGYVTSHSTNSISINSPLRQNKLEQKNGKDIPYTDILAHQKFDHEFYFFDPQYMQAGNNFGIRQGMNSINRRCTYGVDTNHHVLNYGEKFLNSYKNEKKFLLMEFTDSHEITSEVVQYLDDNLSNFLKRIEENGHLEKDTVLYFLSDHGQHLISVFQMLRHPHNVYTVERMLPFYYMLVTKDLLKKYHDIRQNLVENQQNLIDMQGVRQSLLINIYGVYNETNYETNYDKSVFGLLPGDRSCLDIFLRIDIGKFPYYSCSCEPEGMNEEKFLEEWYKKQKERRKIGKANVNQHKKARDMQRLEALILWCNGYELDPIRFFQIKYNENTDCSVINKYAVGTDVLSTMDDLIKREILTDSEEEEIEEDENHINEDEIDNNNDNINNKET